MAHWATPHAGSLQPRKRGTGWRSPRAAATQPAQLGDASAGLAEPQTLAGAVVELVSHAIEIDVGQRAEIGALGKVLAQQPVGVLIGPPLPGRVGVTKVDLDPGGDVECPGTFL